MAQGDDRIADLVRAHQAGDAAALELLVRTIQGPLLGIATTVTRNPVDAEDVFIEAMSRLLPMLTDFATPESFGRYARRSVRNGAVDLLRSRSHRDSRIALRDTASLTRKNDPRPPIDRLPSGESNPEGSLIRAERARTVREAVGALKEPRQTIIRLFYEDGLTYAEIGLRLDLSDTTVKRHLGAARSLLAARLAGQEVADGV